jgi:hypothetical protein
MNDRPTPETDEVYTENRCNPQFGYALLHHARKLERERDQAREESAQYLETLAQERIRNAELRRALGRIANEDYRGNRPPSADIAFHALAAYRENLNTNSPTN